MGLRQQIRAWLLMGSYVFRSFPALVTSGAVATAVNPTRTRKNLLVATSIGAIVSALFLIFVGRFSLPTNWMLYYAFSGAMATFICFLLTSRSKPSKSKE